ncbi:MAG: NAD(P)/FAD-dependent oxidoreductase [Acidimicrobiales bacterium]
MPLIPPAIQEHEVSRSSEVAVIGAGIVGLSTAYSLLERGVAVAVYERGVPGNGQSGGESRIFRHAHDARLVAMACRSRAIWREWERSPTAWSPSGPGRRAGCGCSSEWAAWRPFHRPRRAVRAAAAPRRLLGPGRPRRGRGIDRTRTAIEALTGRLGTSLVPDEVISVRSIAPGRVEVCAGGACGEHSSVVVCAGRATAQLARGVGALAPGQAGGPRPPHLRPARRAAAPAGVPAGWRRRLRRGRGVRRAAARQPQLRPGPQPDSRRAGGRQPPRPRQSHRAERACERLCEAGPSSPGSCPGGLPPLLGDGTSPELAGHNLFKHAPALGRALAQPRSVRGCRASSARRRRWEPSPDPLLHVDHLEGQT